MKSSRVVFAILALVIALSAASIRAEHIVVTAKVTSYERLKPQIAAELVKYLSVKADHKVLEPSEIYTEKREAGTVEHYVWVFWTDHLDRGESKLDATEITRIRSVVADADYQIAIASDWQAYLDLRGLVAPVIEPDEGDQVDEDPPAEVKP